MNKKNKQISYFISLLKLQFFIGFLSINTFTFQDKVRLKLELRKIGLESKVLKNKFFSHIVKSTYPRYINMLPLIQGFCIIVYPKSKTEDIDLIGIQKFAVFIKENSNYTFLGGFFNNSFVNGVFLNKILTLNSHTEIYTQLLHTLSTPSFSFNFVLNTPSSGIIKKNIGKK